MDKIQIQIIDGPLGDRTAANGGTPWSVPDAVGAGAILCFEGIVRPTEQDQPIAGLKYEAYLPMAERELHRLALTALETFGLLAIRIEHSRGVVPIFACSFRLQIASAHRKPGIQALDWFIDQMKQKVPIWKQRIDPPPPPPPTGKDL